MCRVLGVSTSGYYAWRNREPSQRERADAMLTEQIRAIHEWSRSTYGAPRVHAELQDRGVQVGHNRVDRLMRAAGLKGVSRRRGPRTTYRSAEARPAPDLVERNFTADGPDQLWVSDVTYVWTAAGFLYLSVVLDAFSRRIVGWAMANGARAGGPGAAQADTRSGSHPSFGSGESVHVYCLPAAVPGGRCASVDGLGRGLLRQRHVRELLRDP